MKLFVTTITHSIRTTFTGRRYRLLFIAALVLTAFLLVLIPTVSVPGNTFLYQLSLFSPLDVLVTAFLSVLYALFVTMQVYAMRRKRDAKDIGTTLGGGAGALFAGVAGTAFCASCLAPLFAFFGIGFGGVIFVLEYRFFFVAGIVLFMLVALYFTAQKIQKTCGS